MNEEVYVDDMLVKSIQATEHITDLEETFHTLRKHQMKLNPTKCAFGVSLRKFLGFLVSHRGIEANPEKVKAVLERQPPRTTNTISAVNRKNRSTQQTNAFPSSRS
jgi:hypothetical protein